MDKSLVAQVGFYTELLNEDDFPVKMIQDILALLDVPEKSLERIAEELQNLKETLFNPEKIKEILVLQLNEDIDDHRNEAQINDFRVDSLLKIIQSVESEKIEEIMFSLTNWIHENPYNKFILDPDSLPEIKKRLSVICVKLPKYREFLKYCQLHTVTGNILQNLKVVVDLRPMYNETRDAVLEFFPLATLRLEYETPSKQDACLELCLDDNNLDELDEVIQNAKTKIRVLLDAISSEEKNSKDSLQK